MCQCVTQLPVKQFNKISFGPDLPVFTGVWPDLSNDQRCGYDMVAAICPVPVTHRLPPCPVRFTGLFPTPPPASVQVWPDDGLAEPLDWQLRDTSQVGASEDACAALLCSEEQEDRCFAV